MKWKNMKFKIIWLNNQYKKRYIVIVKGLNAKNYIVTVYHLIKLVMIIVIVIIVKI